MIQSVQNNSLTFKAAMSGVATSGPGAGRGQEEGGGDLFSFDDNFDDNCDDNFDDNCDNNCDDNCDDNCDEKGYPLPRDDKKKVE